MKTLLIALDGSPRARQVLEAGAAQARLIQARLVLFRAVGVPVDLPPTVMAISPAEVEKVFEERARADLTELGRTVAAGVPHDVRIGTGMAWSAICEAAHAVDAALIVIGSHGYTRLDRVLGTTAARVVNHADRSVLVVRPPPGTESAGEVTEK
jgi:nucleotide-binding universal stress UspA family protein